MRRFVLVLVLFWFVEESSASVRWWGGLKKREAFSSESFEVPESRRFKVPETFEVDGDRSHLLFATMVPKRSRLLWKIESRKNLSILHKAVRDDRVQDLVLAFRALPDGRLFDDLGQELPESFFEQISPNLRSLSIHTCFGEEVARHYSLREILASGISYHAERSLFVSEQACDDEEVAEPGEPETYRFRSFMKQVERGIVAQQKREWWWDDPVREDPGFALCALAIRSDKTEDLHLGFFLNGHFIGAQEGASEGIDHLQYPCRFLVEGENRIDFRKTLNRNGASVQPAVHLEPIIPGFQVTGQMQESSFSFTLSTFARWFPLREWLIFKSM